MRLIENLPRRLKSRFARLMDEGEFVLLIACLMLSAGVALISTWLMRDIATREKLSDESAISLSQPIEPRDDLPHPGVQIIFTHAANLVFSQALATDTAPERQATRVRKLFKDLVRQINQEHESSDSTFVSSLRMESRLLESLGINESLTASVRHSRAQMKLLNDPGFLEVGENLGISKCGPNDRRWCSTAGNIITVIPPQALVNGKPSLPALRSAVLSQLLDIALTYSDRDDQPPGIVDFVQAYYVSPESLIRVWSKHDVSKIRQAPQAKLWAQSSYARVMWDEGDQKIQTSAYLDLGGNGFVRTTCNKVTDSLDASSLPLGVICTDIALTNSGILALDIELKKNRAAQIEIKRVNDIGLVGNESQLGQETMMAGASSAPRIAQLLTEKNAFFVPLPGGEEFIGWTVRPKSQSLALSQLVFGLIFLTWGLLAIFYARISIRRHAQQRERDSLLMSVPVAYIETVRHLRRVGEVLFWNRRADEILRLTTLSSTTDTIFMDDLFDRLTCPSQNGDFELIRDAHTFFQMRRGGARAFYCRTKRDAQWVRMKIGELVDERRNVRVVSIIEHLSQSDSDLRAKLDSIQ